ncbi:hypothetical protein F5Y01DRAFT_294192 [Xylaria sp. FL0043]|nr:hypothetical protein F5Y01DRAFT_294192 [Xylaria sp. FL0043]
MRGILHSKWTDSCYQMIASASSRTSLGSIIPILFRPFEACIYGQTIHKKTGKIRKRWLQLSVYERHQGIEPDAGVEPATLRLRVSRSTD